ncbi:MAG: hypothetical protein IJD75_04950 [Clostridia bacterium]|nr:hypothetical protein [Clostridia bacterium]
MTALITILIILGVILVSAVLIFFFGNAKLRVISRDQIRVVASICGISFTIYPDKKDAPKKPRNLARCRNPEAVLRRELKRQQRAKEKAERKKEKAAKRAAKRAEKKIGIPQKYCPVPNLKENLEMILALLKKFYHKTRGKIRIKVNKLHIRVSADEAAHTAILYGVVAQLVYRIVAYVEDNYTAIERRDGDLSVDPDYTSSECSAEVDVVFSAKIWRAIFIFVDMVNAYDAEKKIAYRKAALRKREKRNKPRFDLKNILTRIRKDHSLWKTNLRSRK